MSEVKLYVQLLDYTPMPENLVAMAARLCYSGAQVRELSEKVAAADQTAFLERLMDMGHLSPVEHPSFTFGVEGVSRALLAQITRHRIASFSVQSQRYVGQSRKGGLSYIMPPSIRALGEEAQEEYTRQMETIQGWYEQWVERLGGKGEKANEDARFVLPNAAETKMMVTMNARELRHVFELRCCRRAQWEIRAMAWAMLGFCLAKAPALFADAGPGCIALQCPEGKMSCGKRMEVRQKREELNRFVKEHQNDEEFAAELSRWARENA